MATFGPTTLTGPAGATPAAAFVPPAPTSGSPARPILYRFSGPYTGLQGVFEGSFDLSGAFANAFPIRASWAGDGSIQSGTIVVPDSTGASPTAAGYTVYPDAGMAVRFRVTALGSGTPVVDGRDTDFFTGALPSSGTVALATLWQLQHLTFLISQSDEKLGALWQPNPLLPANLLPPAWDTSG